MFVSQGSRLRLRDSRKRAAYRLIAAHYWLACRHGPRCQRGGALAHLEVRYALQQVRRRVIGHECGPGIVAGALQALQAFEVAATGTWPEERGALYLLEW